MRIEAKRFAAFMVALALVGTGWAKAAVILTDDNVSGDWQATSLAGGTAWANPVSAGDNNVFGSAYPNNASPYENGIEITAADTGGLPKTDLIFETVDLPGAMSGNVGTGAGDAFGIKFDFYDGGSSYQVDVLRLYVANGTHTWYYDLAAPSEAATGWTINYAGGFFTRENALNTGVGAWYSNDVGANFLTDLNTATRVGVQVTYDADYAGSMSIGLANFEVWDYEDFYIPEPSTYVMLSTALMSLGYTFARRRRDKAA